MSALTRLRLTDFRNYHALDLKIDERPVCLVGDNGAGKTNILEAVSQLGPGRGLRSAAIADMARTGVDGGWTVAGDLDGRRIGVAAEISGGSAKRVVRIDGAPASPGDLAELVRVVWLVPAMDRIFAGGAGDRRRFLDRIVFAHIPSHGRASSRYEAAMRERNALIDQGRLDPAWMDAVEGRMAEAAATIVANRLRMIEALQTAIDERPEGLFPKGDLSLEGEAERMAGARDDLSALEAAFGDAWRSGRRRDVAMGRTGFGPHRSDLRVVHRPTGAPAAQCSTGQQKALLIGLILASAQAQSEGDKGPPPLLLLDEAAAHLDSDRRVALFDELSTLAGQAWLTGTEAFLFEAFGDRAQRISVKAGAAQPV